MNLAATLDDLATITPWVVAGFGVVGAVVAATAAIVVAVINVRAKRQPSWAEVVAENRALRAESAAATIAARAATAAANAREDDYTDLRREFEDFRDRVEGRDAILTRFLHSAQTQWPLGHPGPVFDHIVDLDLIDDLIPPAWRNVPPVP